MRSNSTRGDGGGEGVNALGGTGTLAVELSSLLATVASGDTGAGGSGLTLTGDEACGSTLGKERASSGEVGAGTTFPGSSSDNPRLTAPPAGGGGGRRMWMGVTGVLAAGGLAVAPTCVFKGEDDEGNGGGGGEGEVPPTDGRCCEGGGGVRAPFTALF